MARSPRKPVRSAETFFLTTECDLEKIDSMISILGLAVGEILRARLVREPPEEMPQGEDFNSQIQLALDEAERQMKFPWGQIDF